MRAYSMDLRERALLDSDAGMKAADTAVIIRVDSKTGALGERRMTLHNPRPRLSFPHGSGILSDGRHLAIANYGDDKVTIYAIRLDAGIAGRSVEFSSEAASLMLDGLKERAKGFHDQRPAGRRGDDHLEMA